MNDTDSRYLEGSNCSEWLEPQNPSFHVSMLIASVAFLIPRTFQYYTISLRSLLVIFLVIFMVWGATFWCTWDFLVWGFVFLVQNLGQLVFALYSMKKIKFSHEIEELYTELFEPLNVTRRQFNALINHNCKWVNIFPGDKYSIENHTTVEARVSFLVTGCLRVTFRGVFLHDIKERQMIDSVEWESSKLRRGELFQVSMEAIDRCFYICWNREKLQFYLEANPEMKVAFDYIRGRDIVKKIHETAFNASRRATSGGGHVNAIGIRRGMYAEEPSLMYESK